MIVPERNCHQFSLFPTKSGREDVVALTKVKMKKMTQMRSHVIMKRRLKSKKRSLISFKEASGKYSLIPFVKLRKSGTTKSHK